jgi:hypothetical protein
MHVGIALRLFKIFHFFKTVCPYIANCYYRLCTNTSDNHCQYCHNEVQDKLYWRGYTRHYDGQMKQCRSKYPTVTVHIHTKDDVWRILNTPLVSSTLIEIFHLFLIPI